jgi:hypothetical protein
MARASKPLDERDEQPQPQVAKPANAFDPEEEYSKLLELVETPAANKRRRRRSSPQGVGEDEVYQKLMGRERRVLDTVDRVVNDAEQRRARREDGLLGMPMHEVAMRTIGAVRQLLDDLLDSRTLADLQAALANEQRRRYLGVALIALALMLGVLQLAG